MKDSTRKIILAFLISVIVICLIVIAVTVTGQKRNSKIYDELAQEEQENMGTEAADEEPVPEIEEQESAALATTEEIADYESPVDFDKLWDINSDIYAWVEIEGTKLAYPVLQSSASDDYYLDVTVEGNHGLPGAIYSQSSYNSKDFDDFNTILYGHNMKDGSMFGILKNYRSNAEYVKEHPDITVYLPNKKLTYHITATIVYGNELIPYKYDLETKNGRQAFIDSVYDNKDPRSKFIDEKKITADDKLLTLSTCLSENRHRYLVIGVLDDDSDN